MHCEDTASLAKWLRRLPYEQQIHVQFPLSVTDFSGLSHTSDIKIDTPVSTQPDYWRRRVSAGTEWPGVSILQLGAIESLI